MESRGNSNLNRVDLEDTYQKNPFIRLSSPRNHNLPSSVLPVALQIVVLIRQSTSARPPTSWNDGRCSLWG